MQVAVKFVTKAGQKAIDKAYNEGISMSKLFLRPQVVKLYEIKTFKDFLSTKVALIMEF